MLIKEIEEKIKCREAFVRAQVEFLHNYSAVRMRKNIEKFSILKIAIEIEKKQNELAEYRSILKIVLSEQGSSRSSNPK